MAATGTCIAHGRDFFMGFRRRTRRRALVAGAVAGGPIAHHERKKYAAEQAADDQAPADDNHDQGPAGEDQEQAQHAAAETEAAARGCSQTVHFTYAFQARALYEHNGYELIGCVQDCPSGTDVLWYRKRLEGRAGRR